MTTEPEPEDPTAYPEPWRPDYIRERDEALEPLAIEKHLAALPEHELALMLQRIRVMR